MYTPLDGSDRGRLLSWAAIPAVIGLGALTLSSLASSPSDQPPPLLIPAGQSCPHFPLAISPDTVELGVVHPGEPVKASLSVRNTQDEGLTVERVETSCLCIDVGRVPVRVEPHQATGLTVTFDPSEDPDFEGRLSVQVTGYLTDGKIGFQTSVNLEVCGRGG